MACIQQGEGLDHPSRIDATEEQWHHCRCHFIGPFPKEYAPAWRAHPSSLEKFRHTIYCIYIYIWCVWMYYIFHYTNTLFESRIFFLWGSLVGIGAPRKCYCEVRWWKAQSLLLAYGNPNLISGRIIQHPSRPDSKTDKIIYIYILVFSCSRSFLFGYLRVLDLYNSHLLVKFWFNTMAFFFGKAIVAVHEPQESDPRSALAYPGLSWSWKPWNYMKS